MEKRQENTEQPIDRAVREMIELGGRDATSEPLAIVMSTGTHIESEYRRQKRAEKAAMEAADSSKPEK